MLNIGKSHLCAPVACSNITKGDALPGDTLQNDCRCVLAILLLSGQRRQHIPDAVLSPAELSANPTFAAMVLPALR